MIDPSFWVLPYDKHLCEALERKGHEVHLCGRPLRPAEQLDQVSFKLRDQFYRLSERLGRAGVPDRVCMLAKGAEHIADMDSLVRWLRKLEPDIIHFQALPVPWLDRLFLNRLTEIAPVVLTVHDANLLHGAASSRLQLLGWRSALEDIAHLIVHTTSSKTQLEDMGLPKSKVRIIPHGILHFAGSKQVTHVSLAPEEHREKMILLFGLIKPYKGTDILIRALAEFDRDMQKSCKVVIAGKPRMDIRPLRNMAESLGVGDRIVWDLRFIPDPEVATLFQRASLIVFPYTEIDASGVLMAALPYGKPIVATRTGCFADLLEDGVHGYLCEPNDALGLSKAMERVLKNPGRADEMGVHVRALSKEVLDWEESASRTLEVYNAALHSGSDSGCQGRFRKDD